MIIRLIPIFLCALLVSASTALAVDVRIDAQGRYRIQTDRQMESELLSASLSNGDLDEAEKAEVAQKLGILNLEDFINWIAEQDQVYITSQALRNYHDRVQN